MPATQATSIAQRREMMRLVEAGHTYTSVAKKNGAFILDSPQMDPPKPTLWD